jgi:hypothetical protein
MTSGTSNCAPPLVRASPAQPHPAAGSCPNPQWRRACRVRHAPPGYFERILGLALHSAFQSALPQWPGRQHRQDPADLGCAVPVRLLRSRTPVTSLSPPQHHQASPSIANPGFAVDWAPKARRRLPFLSGQEFSILNVTFFIHLQHLLRNSRFSLGLLVVHDIASPRRLIPGKIRLGSKSDGAWRCHFLFSCLGFIFLTSVMMTPVRV